MDYYKEKEENKRKKVKKTEKDMKFAGKILQQKWRLGGGEILVDGHISIHTYMKISWIKYH